MSITALLNEAKAQDRELIQFEGIAIYFETDSIPQEVYLIPVKLDSIGAFRDFKDFVYQALDTFQGRALDIDVSCMRWVMPGLLAEIQSMKYIKAAVVYPTISRPLRITACKIYTDTKFSKLITPRPDRVTPFNLQLEEKRYSLNIGNLKAEYGVPRFIEAVLKN